MYRASLECCKQNKTKGTGRNFDSVCNVCNDAPSLDVLQGCDLNSQYRNNRQNARLMVDAALAWKQRFGADYDAEQLPAEMESDREHYQ
jgi:hypothetical protein